MIFKRHASRLYEIEWLLEEEPLYPSWNASVGFYLIEFFRNHLSLRYSSQDLIFTGLIALAVSSRESMHSWFVCDIFNGLSSHNPHFELDSHAE